MEWTPQAAAALARYACPDCRGTGLVPSDGAFALCRCVCRAVFRACYRRFLNCGKKDPSLRRVTFDRLLRAVDRTVSWARRNEDYRADFHACGVRALPRHLYQIFSFYHLHGGTMELVRRRLGLGEAHAWRHVEQIEIAVGREIAHLEPYSLFPPSGYMIPSGRSVRVEENLPLAG